MRPVVKPELPWSLFPADPGAILLQTLGEYCSVSEQPLPAEHYVWNTQSGAAVVGRVDQDKWRDNLLLSEGCFVARQNKLRPKLLLPDDTNRLTFSLRDTPPFQYELAPMKFILLDDNGNALESWDDRVVTVTGLNEEAQATVDYFALNTPWYDRSLGAVVIPKAFFQSGEVRLLWQRTAVYFGAQRLVEAIFSADDRATVIAQGRRLMAAAGFWSTWATVFAHTLPPADRGLLEQLLLPPQPDHWELGPGGHRPFPGTNLAVV